MNNILTRWFLLHEVCFEDSDTVRLEDELGEVLEDPGKRQREVKQTPLAQQVDERREAKRAYYNQQILHCVGPQEAVCHSVPKTSVVVSEFCQSSTHDIDDQGEQYLLLDHEFSRVLPKQHKRPKQQD